MSDYSDVMSDGGMDPRHKLDEAMYRHTVVQRDAAWREVEAWKQRYDLLLKTMADSLNLQANPPMKMLAAAESYEVGRQDGMREEREACAKVCEAHWEIDGTHTARKFADAIRARGQA